MGNNWWAEFRRLLKDQKRSFIVLLSSVLFMILFCYGGDPKHFDGHFHLQERQLDGGMKVYRLGDSPSDPTPYDMYRIFYMFGSAFLCFFVLPLLVVVLVLKESPRNYGLRLPKDYRDLVFALICQTVIAALFYFVYCRDPAQRLIFPYSKYLIETKSVSLFVLYSACYSSYYVGWEFFFRGFMQLGTEAQAGAPVSIMLQVIPSAIIHLGNPISMPKTVEETFSAVIMGIIWGVMVWRTRSVLLPFLMHYGVGIMFDGFITFGPAT
ncbi:MAG TPA: CPBP family intramembrane glutamic endopeptidase [Blastocatellia bacterium]|nr:CPBP family intramembrane glutamic endopeptidase [Blastocatellia bacterium]